MSAPSVQIELTRIFIREMVDLQIIELSEVGGTRSFPIVIGMTEACAIERRRKGCSVERPQTHDLLATVIEELGATVDRIEIVALKEKTFFAQIILRRGSKEFVIDARPSDAIAIGVACNAPMFATEEVIAEASAAPNDLIPPLVHDQDAEDAEDAEDADDADDADEDDGEDDGEDLFGDPDKKTDED